MMMAYFFTLKDNYKFGNTVGVQTFFRKFFKVTLSEATAAFVNYLTVNGGKVK